MQDAHASLFVDLKDQASCQAAPLSGTWFAANSTCHIGNLTLNSGDEMDVDNSVYNNFTLTIIGTVNNAGSIEGSGNSPFNQKVVNEGIVNTSGLLSEPNFVNKGTISNNGTMFDSGTFTNTGTLTNNGVLKLYFITTTFSGPNTYSGGFTNTGTFIMNSGSTLYLGTGANFVINSGAFAIPSGVTLFYSGSTLSINSGASLSNNGTITSYGPITNSGSITNIGTITNNYTITNNGSITNNGTITNKDVIVNNGTITNECGGSISNSGKISGNQIVYGCFTTPVTLSPDKDSYIIHDSPNVNEGASSILKVQHLSVMRTIVSFDLSPYESSHIANATLRVFAALNGFHWGTGESIEAHKLTTGWTEGNGFNATKGTGSGATWSCATDTHIANSLPNCNIKWNGGSFVASPTSTIPVTNKTKSVWLEFNVTSDVASFLDGNPSDNFGWIIKKTNENSSGSIEFDSKENADVSHRPQLVLTFGP